MDNSFDGQKDIITLQNKLKKMGYYDASITGSLDTYTKWAITNFQRDYGLEDYKAIHKELLNIIHNVTSHVKVNDEKRQTRPVLKPGSTGPEVIELQTILTKLLYYTGSIDGKFGMATSNAVKTFQANNNLIPDGIVGRDTWSALVTLYSPLAICGEDSNTDLVYTVVSGDTLWSIAQRFHTTVSAIKQHNNLASDIILIGQKLYIPGTASEKPTYIIYTVIAGDTLWNLAKKFHTTVDAIKRLNNLTGNLLTIGMQLKIPTNTTV